MQTAGDVAVTRELPPGDFARLYGRACTAQDRQSKPRNPATMFCEIGRRERRRIRRANYFKQSRIHYELPRRL